MIVDVNTSAWLESLPQRTTRPTLGQEIEADVCIIGGGLAGISTAYRLNQAQPDTRIVLLEAHRLANGASGRNGGLVMTYLPGAHPQSPQEIEKTYTFMKEGIDALEQSIQAHDLDVPFYRRGGIRIYSHEKEAQVARARVAMFNQMRVARRFIEPEAVADELGVANVHGAVFEPNEAVLHSAAYVTALGKFVEDQGVQIFEDSTVTGILEGEHVTVTTPNGSVRARRIVLATNAYTPALGYFRYGIVPVTTHIIASSPQDEATWKSKGWPIGVGVTDDSDRVAYGCVNFDGRLVFGGGNNASYTYNMGARPPSKRDIQRGDNGVRKRLLAYAPQLGDLDMRTSWHGTVGLTASRLCTVGVCGAHHNVYYALGFSGCGIVATTTAGRILADMLCNNAKRWHWVPFVGHKLEWIPPEPLRWLGYHAYTALTGRSPRRDVNPHHAL